jgi:tetratricopeptide (TPR) repeat protein
MEALKAFGRLAKGWRSAAALLPDRDEAKLGFAGRAERLRARAAAVAESDPPAAQAWLERALATDPDDFRSWDALATLHAAAGDHKAALTASRAALAAFERSVAPDPSHLREHAARIQALAEATTEAGEAERLAARAFALAPAYARAALAVADRRVRAGELDLARDIYDRLLAPSTRLEPGERLQASFARGQLAARDGRWDAAIADLREGLRIDPLHPGLLHALAGVLARSGRVAAAAQHYIQALLPATDARERGRYYAELGRLWEEQLSHPDEARVCYEASIASGLTEDTELMMRLVGHYRATNQPERAGAMLDRLIPRTTDPSTLSRLWAARGAVLARAGSPGVIEAYDTALSYDPSCIEAVQGLAQVLEEKRDWNQLVELLEARSEVGAPPERADALRRLARVAQEELGDRARAEGYLRAVIDLGAQKEDYERLLGLYGDDPARARDRQTALADLLAIAGPWMPRLIEIGLDLAKAGHRRWAWCLLSPLVQTIPPDAQLKSLVADLRKEFDKAENVGALSPGTYLAVRHSDLYPEFYRVIAELDAAVPFGPTSPEAVGAGGLAKVDGKTAVGKAFAQIAERLGMPDATLSRAQKLGAPLVVLDSPTPHVLVRSDALQVVLPGEFNFLFATMLEQARLGARLVSSLGPEESWKLVPALLAAVDHESTAPEVAALTQQLRRTVDPAQLAAWANCLCEFERPPVPSAELGRRFARAVSETARRVGLVAAGELRLAARTLPRLEESVPKLSVATKVEDLDGFFAEAPLVRALVGFALTHEFGLALAPEGSSGYEPVKGGPSRTERR